MIKFLLFIAFFYFIVKFISRMFLPSPGSRQSSAGSPFQQFTQFYQQQQQRQRQQQNQNRHGDQYTRSQSSTGNTSQQRFEGVEEADFEIIDEDQDQKQNS
jgi:hypothetical protein